MKIRLFKPSVGKSELKLVKKTFDKSWLGFGENVKEFENKWKKKFNVKEAIAVNSCTAALHSALAIHKFKKNKEVLVPAISFSATAAVTLYSGLKPKFVDVNKYDLNINFEDLKKKYTKNCVALILVHMGGHPCELEKIIPWARRKKILIIEDCAETCGGSYKGKKLGTWGDLGCYSFEEKKIMTTGDGGMISTNDKKKAKKLRSFTFHGWNIDPLTRHKKSFNKKFNNWEYDILEPGYKYNMNNLVASLGIAQLNKLKWLNSSREKLIKFYLKELANLKNIKPTLPHNLKDSSYWIFSLKCSKRNSFINFLKSEGISTSIHFKPLQLLKAYKKYKHQTPNAKKIWKEIVTLPLFPELKFKEVKYICSKIRYFDKNYAEY